ncbi:MAG: sodium:proton exchanger, partial [Raoultibacter sp.]
EASINNIELIGYVIVITLGLHLIRFLWLAGMNFIESRCKPAHQTLGNLSFRDLLIMTLSGARGAITLSLVFTIPWYNEIGNGFPQRSLIIFIASGVIVLTLIIATFIVPLLAPKRDTSESSLLAEEEAETVMDILRSVIEELTTHQTPENRRATQRVIKSYNERINKVKNSNDIEIEPNKELRIKALRWEQDYTLELIDNGRVDPMIGYQYLNHLAHIQNLLKHQKENFWVRRNALRRLSLFARSLKRRIINALPGKNPSQKLEEFRSIQVAASEYAISKLQQEITDPNAPTEDVSELILEYQRSIAALRTTRSGTAPSSNNAPTTADIELLGLKIELEQIQSMYEADRLSRASAKRLRENVYLMQIDIEERI